jgi:hypothetical protein
MLRYKKLLLLMLSLASLGIVGLVLHQIQQNAEQPFPGAVVVLDNALWRSRKDQDWAYGGYLWASPNTILYTLETASGSQVLLQRIVPNAPPSPPQRLPVLLKEMEYIDSLSPDGKRLCLHTVSASRIASRIIVRTDGQGKAIEVTTEAGEAFWSSDSKFLYALPYETNPIVLERYDVQTGSVTKTTINTRHDLILTGVTPEGKLLCLDEHAPEHTGKPDWGWELMEVRGSSVVQSSYRKRFPFASASLFLSPDGKRLLWQIPDSEMTVWEKWQQTFLRKAGRSHEIYRWMVTEIDGSNGRTIGITPREESMMMQPIPEWTPDSRAVHFVHDKKLWRLDVP